MHTSVDDNCGCRGATGCCLVVIPGALTSELTEAEPVGLSGD